MQALYKKFGIKVIRVSLIRRADYRNQMPNYCYKLVAPALPVPLRRLYHRYGLLGRGAFGEAPAGRVMGKSGKATSVRVSGQDARKGQVQRNRELVERDEFGEDADVDACRPLGGAPMPTCQAAEVGTSISELQMFVDKQRPDHIDREVCVWAATVLILCTQNTSTPTTTLCFAPQPYLP